MTGHFKPMLNKLVTRGIISRETANELHETTSSGKADDETYQIARDFILHHYYANTHEDIPGGTKPGSPRSNLRSMQKERN